VLDTIGILDTMFTVDPLQENKVYWWRVKAQNNFGYSQWSDSSGFQTINLASINSDEKMPLAYSLSQNYPNPFNNNTRIKFSIKETGYVSLKVYDISGREIETVIEGNLNRGYYDVEYSSNNLASGIYVYMLKSKDILIFKKMMLLK